MHTRMEGHIAEAECAVFDCGAALSVRLAAQRTYRTNMKTPIIALEGWCGG